MKKINFLNGIFFKTFIKLLMLMLALVLFVHGCIYFLYSNRNMEQQTNALTTNMNYLTQIAQDLDEPGLMKSAEALSKVEDININITKNGQRTIFGSSSIILFEDIEEEDVSIKGHDYDSLMVRSDEVHVGGEVIHIQMAKSLQQINEAINVSFSFMPYTIFAAMLLSLMASYFYSKNITKPILEMDRALNEMISLNPDAAASQNRSDELGRLSKSIDQVYLSLLQNINDYKTSNEFIVKMEQKRLDFLKATSHELKTPIAKLSILLENMLLNIGKYKDRDTYLAQANDITQDLSEMIKDILNNLKGNSIDHRIYDTILLKQKLNESLQYYSIFLQSRQITIDLELDDTQIKMDESELDFLLSNILSNISKHARPNSVVTISLRSSILTFQNIPDEVEEREIETIIHSSNGLGIEIIRSIAKDNDIDLSYEMEKEYLITTLDFSALDINELQ